MRLHIVREIFLKELRETLRDRRTLAVMFGIPLLLYPLLTMSLAGLSASTAQRLTRQVARVAVVQGAGAPRLLSQLREAESGIRVVEHPQPLAGLAAGELDAVLELSPRFEARALRAEDVDITLRLDTSRAHSSYVERKVETALEQYERWIIRERLRRRGVPEDVIRPLRRNLRDVASAEGRLGSRLATLLPMMLLITGMLGAFFPAVATTTAERELGTLEALLVTPAGRMEILLGKTLLVVLFSLLTAGLNLLSMALVLWRTFTMLGASAAREMSLDPGLLLLSYLAAVPTLVFCSAAVMVVGLFARNYREANSYSTPVMLLSLLPVLISVTDPKTTPALLATPLVNTTLVIRDVLSGRGSAGEFLLAFASSGLYAGLMLSAAARLFRAESLVNPAWEPLSVRGLRAAGRRRPRLPTVDEALLMFGVQMLLLFYLTPEWARLGLFPLLVLTQGVCIAGPALAFAGVFRYRWRETFSLRRTTPAALAGAALLGVGAMPWVQAAAELQSRFWKADPEVARATAEMLVPALAQHPLLVALGVGLLAGVSEELAFRGPVQAALAKRLPAWAVLVGGAVIFAAAHMDAHGFGLRAVLGVTLGWLVLRGGSLYPAIVMHAVYDAAALLAGAAAVRRLGEQRYLELAGGAPRAAGEAIFPSEWSLAALALGAVCLLLGWVLCRRAFSRAAAESTA